MVVTLDDKGVTMSALLRKKIIWQDIVSLQLRYYAVKRDRSQGWMQLTIRSPDSKMQIESTIEAFEEIVGPAAREAEQRKIELSEATIENIKALGLPTDRLQGVPGSPVETA